MSIYGTFSTAYVEAMRLRLSALEPENKDLRDRVAELEARCKRLEEALGLVLKMRDDWLESQDDGYAGAYHAFVKGNDSKWDVITKAKEAKP